MIAIAAIAVLMVPFRIALDNPFSVWMRLGIVAIFGPSVGFLVFPIAVDWIAGTFRCGPAPRRVERRPFVLLRPKLDSGGSSLPST
jgi:biotin transporter BioY